MKHRFSKILRFCFWMLLLAGIFYWRLFSAPDAVSGDFPTMFSIEDGMTAEKIAENLESQNLIRSGRVFLLVAQFKNVDTKIRPGRYLLNSGMNLGEILYTLTDPNRPQTKITFPEGFSISQMDKKLSEQGFINPGDFFAEAQTFEGYLFPDTYFVFSRNFMPGDLIQKMKAAFEEKMTPELQAEAEKNGRSLAAIITMASILEREAKTAEDLPVVAGILWKRIDNGWPLQADATLLYEHSSRDITTEDIKDSENPYNTYAHKGLPPTPIGNPGLATIRAALFPKESPYWFYLTDKDGNIHYAKTNEEHNENRRKYLGH